MRLFIAINFNAKTKARLLVLRDELRSCSRRGNYTLPENLHLTLVFLGECDTEQLATIKSVMDSVDFEPFKLEVERVGRFRRNGGDIWWAGIAESKQLIDLHGELTNKLIAAGFSLDKRKYSPHITLGREVITNAVPRVIESFCETVNNIDLMKSEHINGRLTYTIIKTP